MSPTIYALLVGINDYVGGVPSLKGCVNDVKRMLEFLRERTIGGDYVLDAMMLTSGDPTNATEQKPTRNAVIDAFRSHLTKAKKGDIALFYYSGHGSQEKTPQWFRKLEPDGLDETLVCYDSREEGQWDLADKELAILIEEVARKDPNILVILDSCHSGSGTRNVSGTNIRLHDQDSRMRSLDDFLPEVKNAVEHWFDDKAAEEQDSRTGNWIYLPQGRHVVIAACRPEETAREKLMPNGEVRGILSYYLLDTLQQVGPTLSYRDVISRTSTSVHNLIRDQNPLIAATVSDDENKPFLGGAIVEQLPYYDLVYEVAEQNWFIRAGAIHGLLQPDGDETTYLAVFPLGQHIEPGIDMETAIGTVKVNEVQAGKSRVQWAADNVSPETDQTYKAVVVATPLSSVTVQLMGDDLPALERLNEVLVKSLIVRVVNNAAEAHVQVNADQSDKVYRLKRAGDLESLNVVIPKEATSSATNTAIATVEHMAQWMQILNLQNTQSQLPTDAVRMEIYRYYPETQKSELLDDQASIRLKYDPKQSPKGVPIQIRLIHANEYKAPLYCMLVDLTDDFEVTVDHLFGSGIWLEPGQETWVSGKSGEPFIYAYVPKKLLDQGISKTQDVLKLIVSTDESDVKLLRQDALEVVAAPNRIVIKPVVKKLPPSSLHRLLQRVHTRATGEEEVSGKLSDWRTSQALLTIVSQEATLIESDRDTTLAEGVTIQAHPILKAKAQLVQFDEGKRDTGNLSLPAVFRFNTNLGEPFNFRPGRGGDAGASVIVLNDVESAQAVTPEQPLIILAETQLNENEAVLPFAFEMGNEKESGLYIPLGVGVLKDGAVRIQLDRLPKPKAESDSRGIMGSVKLFFQKVIIEKIGPEKFGVDMPNAKLAAVTIIDGRLVSDDSPITLVQKVRDAKRILLYIHGILGDTRGMVQSAYELRAEATNSTTRLADSYDLVLAFDYENINTPIEETAQNLKRALAKIGLTPDHGKTLHVVAHSLGCLVLRQFVERDNGSKFVNKAVLVAPPNAGSPWATIQDYVLIGLGAVLTGITTSIWPPSLIPALLATLAAVEKVDVTLDQMKPGSPFFKVLNASEDPGLSYAIIAGNTSQIMYDKLPTDVEAAEQTVFERLIRRLGSPETVHQLLDLAFFNDANDIAVSVKSMVSLPSYYPLQIPPVEVACDHNSYFTTEVGLSAIVKALQDEG